MSWENYRGRWGICELIREKKIRAVKIGQWKIKPEDLGVLWLEPL